MPSKLRRYDEYGHIHFLTISCYRQLQFLRHDQVKQVLVDALARTRTKLGIRWIAYVAMPEHVYNLVFPMAAGTEEPVSISTVLQPVKQYAGRHGKEALRSIRGEARSLGSPPLDRWAVGTGPKPFWKTRAHDFNVPSEGAFDEQNGIPRRGDHQCPLTPKP